MDLEQKTTFRVYLCTSADTTASFTYPLACHRAYAYDEALAEATHSTIVLIGRSFASFMLPHASSAANSRSLAILPNLFLRTPPHIIA
eukprot:6207053-Pleurochrysis_carterae.AAC.2